MTHFVLQMHAYDCLDAVNWVIRIKDWDADGDGYENGVHCLTGAMQGRGSEDPTRWLRELLEGLREAM